MALTIAGMLQDFGFDVHVDRNDHITAEWQEGPYGVVLSAHEAFETYDGRLEPANLDFSLASKEWDPDADYLLLMGWSDDEPYWGAGEPPDADRAIAVLKDLRFKLK